MNKVVYPVALVLMASFCGCGEDEKGASPEVSKPSSQTVHEPWAPRFTNPELTDVPLAEKPKSVPEMDQDDIVVDVNGEKLYRRDVDVKLRQKQWMLARNRTLDARKKGTLYRLYGEGMINKFIETQLLVQEGRKIGGLSEADIRQHVEQGVDKLSKTLRLSLEDIDRELPGGLDSVRRDLENEAWASFYAISNITPKVQADDAMVARIRGQIDAENAEAVATNAFKRTHLAGIRDALVRGEISFGAAADKYAEDVHMAKDGTGYWGVFTKEEIDDPRLKAIAFEHEDGYLSEIYEDEEFLSLIKIISTHPAGEDNTPLEGVELGRIALEKAQIAELAEPENLKASLQAQMRGIAVSERVKELKAAARITYPHGTDFWGVAAKREARKKEREIQREKARRYREERKARREAVEKAKAAEQGTATEESK